MEMWTSLGLILLGGLLYRASSTTITIPLVSVDRPTILLGPQLQISILNPLECMVAIMPQESTVIGGMILYLAGLKVLPFQAPSIPGMIRTPGFLRLPNFRNTR